MTPPESEPRIATMEISEFEAKIKELQNKIAYKQTQIEEIEEILNDQEYMDEHDKNKLSFDKIVELEDEKGIFKDKKKALEDEVISTQKEKHNVLKRNTLLN
ncbi:MAG TPA: hypothetical protein VIH31_02335 [Candidatus Paceibacterota bacterium]